MRVWFACRPLMVVVVMLRWVTRKALDMVRVSYRPTTPVRLIRVSSIWSMALMKRAAPS